MARLERSTFAPPSPLPSIDGAVTFVITEVAWGLRFTVLVQPRASRTELSGAHGGALRLRVQAPPVDGAANDAVIAFLAETLGIRRRDVRIVAGETSRSKIVDVAGVTRAEVEQLGMIIGRR